MLPVLPELATAQGCHNWLRCSRAEAPGMAGTSSGRQVGSSAEVGNAAKQISTSSMDMASCTHGRTHFMEKNKRAVIVSGHAAMPRACV